MRFIVNCGRRVTVPNEERMRAAGLPGYEASTWNGVGAPRGTPAEIVDKLNREINEGLADPKMRVRLAEMGASALPGSADDFVKLIADEIEKWGKVIRTAKIKAE